MQAVLTDLDSVAHFLVQTDSRARVTRSGSTLELVLPDDAGLILIEWPPGAPVQVRLPIAEVPEVRTGAVLELLSDANSRLVVLGFVLDRSTSWVEFRTTVFPDEAGAVSTMVLARVVVSVQEAVASIGGQLDEVFRREAPVPPSWWDAE